MSKRLIFTVRRTWTVTDVVQIRAADVEAALFEADEPLLNLEEAESELVDAQVVASCEDDGGCDSARKERD